MPEQSTATNFSAQAAEWLAQADRHIRGGNPGAAEALLKQAIETHPELDPAYHTLGLIAFETGNLAQAAELIGAAVSLRPTNALYHRNWGELLRRLGRFDEAVKEGQYACQLAPQDVDSHFNLGLALANQGVWPDAISAYQRALSLTPDHGLAWNNLGVAQERCGQRNEAVHSYRQAVQLNPQHVEAQFNLGVMHRQAGRLSEANECFRLVEEMAPGFSRENGVTAHRPIESTFPPQSSVRDTHTPKGRGVFVERFVRAGELVETAPVILLHVPYQTLPEEIKSYVFNWGKLCGIGSANALALGYGSLFNHDNPANLRYEADPANLALRFIATRDITTGEELTINYNAPHGTDENNSANWFDRMNIKPIVSSSPQ